MAAESSTASSTSRSGGGGGEATADSYIGSLISLTSMSEIRYEGILYNINTEESSIGLRNVRSFGSEGRKKDGPQVPPSEKIYEYILFRGSDIKDLQVKASPPVQNTPPVNNDPAIIQQSHYPVPTPTPPTNLPLAPGGSVPDIGPHASPMGLAGQALQSSLPLYQPGAHLNSWGLSPPNADSTGLAIPMYWQGFYGAPDGLPQLPQQSLLRPPMGLPSSMQQMQFASLNSSLPTTASSLTGSNLPDYHSSLVPNSASLSSLTSSLPASNLPLNVPPPQPMSLTSETANSLFPNKPLLSAAPLNSPKPNLPLVPPLSSYSSVPDNVALLSVSSKPSVVSGSAVLPQEGISQLPVKPVSLASSIAITETQTPSLVTPGQLLQFGSSSAASQPLQTTTHKGVEVVQVSPKQSPEPSASVAKEVQPPILPLPQNARSYNKPNGGAYNMRNQYRGRGGRGPGYTRPMTKFTEDFDFEAMNEKFNKDDLLGEDDADKTEIKGLYNKDDFFDSLSCNAMANNPNNHGRPRYSEQMKLDTETFGDFSRFRGGRGGRGGGRYRGGSSYYGRGYGGYNYGNRGRGHGVQGHTP